VQELERQLSEAKQAFHGLQARLQEGSVQNPDSRPSDAADLKLPELNSKAERRRDPPVLNNFDHVRNNVRIYGRGIFKPPPMYRHPAHAALFSANDTHLPQKSLTDRLLSNYYYHIHRQLSILHWPTFTNQVEEVYARGTFQGSPQTWVSLFLAVLACGTLHKSNETPDTAKADPDGVNFVTLSMRAVNTWSDELSIDTARTTLLYSVFMTELNIKSAGWVWLASAVRIAQDIGLHYETGPWTVLEAEMRRRVWWGIYTWDR